MNAVKQFGCLDIRALFVTFPGTQIQRKLLKPTSAYEDVGVSWSPPTVMGIMIHMTVIDASFCDESATFSNDELSRLVEFSPVRESFLTRSCLDTFWDYLGARHSSGIDGRRYELATILKMVECHFHCIKRVAGSESEQTVRSMVSLVLHMAVLAFDAIDGAAGSVEGEGGGMERRGETSAAAAGGGGSSGHEGEHALGGGYAGGERRERDVGTEEGRVVFEGQAAEQDEGDKWPDEISGHWEKRLRTSGNSSEGQRVSGTGILARSRVLKVVEELRVREIITTPALRFIQVRGNIDYAICHTTTGSRIERTAYEDTLVTLEAKAVRSMDNPASLSQAYAEAHAILEGRRRAGHG